MIRDDIIAGLRAPNAKAALADAVGHVAELAPAVYALAGKFCRASIYCRLTLACCSMVSMCSPLRAIPVFAII